MDVRVLSTLGDLGRDYAKKPGRLASGAPRVVRKTAQDGNRHAVRIARRASGPHGASYYKRLSAEARTPTSWEFGPEGIPKSEFVGAGYRNAGGNRDLPQAADLMLPGFYRRTDDLLDQVFGGD